MVREVPGPSRDRSQCAPLGEVPPFGFSEREEPRPFEARVCHRGQYRPVAFQSTSGRDAHGHLTPRPLCDRGVPSAPGESKRLGIPRVRRSGGLVQALGRLHVVPLGKGVAEQYSATRRAATPPQKRQTCTPGSTACTREEHLHHSHNTHRRSHSGTPHAQRSDACTVFHVSAYACGAGVFSSGGSRVRAQRTLSPFLRLFLRAVHLRYFRLRGAWLRVRVIVQRQLVRSPCRMMVLEYCQCFPLPCLVSEAVRITCSLLSSFLMRESS